MKNSKNNHGRVRAGFIKRLAAALAAVLCLAVLAACGKNGGSTKLVFTTSFGKDEVFRIGDESCQKNELMVYLTTIQNQYESVYGEEIWNTSLDGVTLEENVKEMVLARLAQVKTMYMLALEKGITLEEAEEKNIALAASEYYGSLNEAEIQAMGVTQDTIQELYREYIMAEKVYQQIIQDINPEISDDEARTVKVQHIFFGTVMRDGAGGIVSYDGERKRAVYEKACDVRALAVDGEHDFEQLAAQYSENSVITCSFGKGEMDIAIEDAAFNLETGEVSEVVESEKGFHIIKCISTLDREETDANKLEIVEQRRKEVFGQEYNVFVSTLVRSLNDKLWDQITLIHDSEVTTEDFFEVYDRYL